MDDDSGYNYSGAESALVPTPQGVPIEIPYDSPATSGTTQDGNPGNNTSQDMGKRINNPLAQYSSYTYNISLYMITPDAYDVFVRSGRKDIEIVNTAGADCGGGAYLLCQSGGINNTTSQRAPGFHYDYFIDNLVVDSVLSPSGNFSPTTNVKCSFTIIEQYGFSFITNLKRAKESLELYSSTTNYKDSANASRQFFVIGLKFAGYDQNGDVFTGAEHTYERYYDIMLTKINFKLDGRTTTYQIEAVTVPPTVSMGQKRGIIDKGANQLQGSTVQELCNALTAKLNNDQQEAVKKGDREFPNNYSINFVTDDAKTIAQSKIVSDADVDKIKWPMGTVKEKIQVNPSLSIKSQPNKDARIIAFNADTPIIQAIQSIVTQSDYIINGLTKVYTTDQQPNKEGNKEKIESNKRLKWFNISSLVSKANWDKKIKDFSFDIEYQIKTYETPVVLAASADKTTPYYGPFKRYEYWWTGLNTEVIKYEQAMNNAYFTVALSADGLTPESTGGNANVPVALGKRQPVQRLGKLDLGMEAQNSYVTSLQDPGAYATAKIEILGDPDLLSNDMPTGDPELDASKTPFYGPDGYSLDARAGQVFIEVNFKEAVDYDNGQGTLTINDKVLFWDYPPDIQKQIDERGGGISYQLIQVKSMFRGGKFTQELQLTMNTFGFNEGYGESEQGREEAKQQAENDNEMQRLSKKGNSPVGLKQDAPPTEGAAGGDPCGPAATTKPANQETNNNGVANDDSNPSTGTPSDVMGNPVGGGLPGA